jgi:hypothetical protein
MSAMGAERDLSATKPSVRSLPVAARRVGWRDVRPGGATAPDRMAPTGTERICYTCPPPNRNGHRMGALV